VQQLVGPGPLSYLILRYSLNRGASAHGRERARCRRLFALARAVLLVRLVNPSQRFAYACAARSVACAVHRRARLCRAANGGARICAWLHHRRRPHGQMELSARGPEPRRGTRRDAGDTADLLRPRTLLVLAGVALPILPFALWLAIIDPDLVGRRRAAVTGSPESSSLCSGWRSQTRVPGDDK